VPSTLDPYGPTSRIYFSQRLRLHYVDWGNPGAPPLLLVHGGRDHCRNWDWVASALRHDYHILAPDLRGHGDSQWSPDGSYSVAAYIYDLAQLIHQQELAPVTIIAHSLGGMLTLRYAGIYPENVRKIVAIEGLGMTPRAIVDRAKQPIADRMQRWIEQQRDLSGRLPRRYTSIDEALKRMQEANRFLSPEQARPGRNPGPVAAHRLPGPPRLRQGKLGLEPRRRRPHQAFQRRPRRLLRKSRPLGPPRPAGRVFGAAAGVSGLSPDWTAGVSPASSAGLRARRPRSYFPAKIG
jgi:pimeloyl-ACP methyl ester carboxylesterase